MMTCTPLRSSLILLFASLALLLAGTAGPGCASIVPPTGGPRDSLPPVLVSAIPADSTANFSGKRIVLTFNEYVQLDNPMQNLLVNPQPRNPPQVQSKLRTVTVTLNDTLEEQTTYTLDFGKTIKDINEGNLLRNFRYVFSTGPVFDSLQIGGTVTVAETGLPDSTLIVMLHKSLDDSAVVKETPRYVARLDSSGRFLFRNLPADTFAIYALKDEGGSRKYLSRQQLFAFADSHVVSTSGRTDLRLYAFIPPDTASPAKPAAPPRPPTRRGQQAPDSIFRIQSGAQGAQDLLSPAEFNFPMAPLDRFLSDSVILFDNSFRPVPNYRLVLDSTRQKLQLHHAWSEQTLYHVIFRPGFAVDTAGRALVRPDTVSFQTRRQAEYGLLNLRFFNLPLDRNPLLLFVQGGQVKHTHIFTDNRFHARLFPPGEYDLRIVFDENRNGKWDTGNFFGERRQPEIVIPVRRRIQVRANWDNEVDIQL